MRLFKKLIPIATVASVSAIVVPLVTSCGGYTKLDGSKVYIPKAAKATPDKSIQYGYDEATKLYHDDLVKNKNIFKEDMYCWLSLFLMENVTYFKAYNIDAKPMIKLNYSNLKVGDIYGEDHDKHFNLSYTVSGSVNIDLRFNTLKNSNSANKDYKDADIVNIKSFKATVTDFPYSATDQYYYRWGSYDLGDWGIAPENLNDASDYSNSWSIKLKAKGSLMWEESGLVVLNNEEFIADKTHSISDWTWQQQVFGTQIFELLPQVAASYHLQDIELYI